MKPIACAAMIAVGLTLPAQAADLGMGMLSYDQGDYPNALAEWTPLADAGDPTAQSLLAMMYRSGEGVRRDPTAAAELYARAARQGHPYAQYNFAEMLRGGEGVPRNLELAFVWFSLAADQIRAGADGSSMASRARDAVAAQLTAGQLQIAQQLADDFRPRAE